FLPTDLSDEPAAKDRFIHEARAASSLDQPNICAVHEIGETKSGALYIVMPFYGGSTLKHRLDGKPISQDEAVGVILQILSALARVHEAGIYHRDIKPANIMVTDRGVVKLLDFGVAKLESSTRLTRTGSSIGTVLYMSPEQARGAEVDHRTDLWSTGVVLYEMLTGVVPFGADYDQAVIYNIINSEPKPPRSVNSEIRQTLSDATMALLEKDPARRPASAEAAAELLTSIEPGGEVRSGSNGRSGALSREHRRLVSLIGLALVLVFAAAAFFWSRSNGSDLVILPGDAKQFTDAPGLEVDPAFSPDGKLLAYSAGSVHSMDIYVRQTFGGRAINLTDELPGHHRWPQWSPDGTRIAFVSTRGSRSIISIIPALGGSLEAVAAPEIESIEFSPASPGIAAGSPTWSPDGNAIAYVEGNELRAYALDAKGSRLITESNLPHSSRWSPDGSLIAFAAGNDEFVFGTITFANNAPNSIQVVNAEGGEPIELVSNQSTNVSPVWAPDGRHLFYASSQAGALDIYYLGLDRSGRRATPPIRLTTGLSAFGFSLSPDLKRIAYARLDYRANIWSIRIPDDGLVSIAEAEPVTVGSQVIESVSVTRDGSRIAYSSDRSGNAELYVKDLPDGEPVQLTHHEAGDFLPSWSPDLSEIVFHSFRDGNRDVHVVSLDGQAVTTVDDDPASERNPDWAPDGNRIVFQSDRAGQQNLYAVSRDPQTGVWADVRRLTDEPSNYGRWSPDGQSIVFISIPLKSVRIVSPDGGSIRTVVDASAHQDLSYPVFAEWSPDSRTIYYTTVSDDGQSAFWSVSADGGVPRKLVEFDVPSHRAIRQIFDTDGERLYFTIPERESDIWIMELLAG
ncbi:MAG TPA: protein kinase, partial [Rhodothermales bacterium]